VEDLGSSNGTFLRGQKLDGPNPIRVGDEIGFGKFSIVFDKVVGDSVAEAGRARVAQTAPAEAEGTTHIRASEVRELLQNAERKKRAHLKWESGGQEGSHIPSETPAALFGTDDLCDVKVPKGPKHHVLVVNREGGCEVRNLTAWSKMTFRGRPTKKVVLKDGDFVEIGGLKLTMVADIA
jgi:pSer/pThr/pTyr-binding forkhead associated (FHA) protein